MFFILLEVTIKNLSKIHINCQIRGSNDFFSDLEKWKGRKLQIVDFNKENFHLKSVCCLDKQIFSKIHWNWKKIVKLYRLNWDFSIVPRFIDLWFLSANNLNRNGHLCDNYKIMDDLDQHCLCSEFDSSNM